MSHATNTQAKKSQFGPSYLYVLPNLCALSAGEFCGSVLQHGGDWGRLVIRRQRNINVLFSLLCQLLIDGQSKAPTQ